ncbi:hypothetical protein JXC34_01890 [Candidatus Woesearchaeota archaeon]|nr:hypothetical protein [Candidatus Woesearchaeota archaeon]
MKKIIIAVIMSLFLVSIAYAGYSKTYIRNLELESEEVISGDTLKISFELENQEDKPIVDGYFVFDIEHDEENIVLEQIERDVSIRQEETADFEYEIKLPENLKPGKYKLNIYFKTPRTDIIGYPQIFALPVSTGFEVANEGSVNDLRIIREKTLVCGELSAIDYRYGCYADQLGPVVQPGEENTLNVTLKNFGEVLENLKLRTTIAMWDDTSEDPESTQTTIIGKMAKDHEALVVVGFTNPVEPGAYSIKIEAIGENEKLYSLYRSRIVVEGGSARIREVSVDDYKYSDNQQGKAYVMLSAPADAKSDFGQGKISFKITDKKTDETIYDSEEPFKFTGKTFEKEFTFNTPKNLEEFEVSIAAYGPGNIKVDEYNYEVNPYKFVSVPAKITVLFSEDPMFRETFTQILKNKVIYIKVSIMDEVGRAVDKKIRMTVKSDSTNIGPFEFNEKYALQSMLPPGEYEFSFKSGNLIHTETLEIVGSRMPGFLTKDTITYLSVSLAVILILALLIFITNKGKNEKEKGKK